MNASKFSIAPLNDFSVIKITGDDAATFLHGQLTQDVTGLVPKHARLAGYCTPNGRLLATLVIWADPTHEKQFLALVKADIAEALVKRLSMFVLRAKVKLEIEPLSVWGVLPTQAQPALADWQSHLPSVDAPVWSVVYNEAGTWISAPRSKPDSARWWLLTSQGLTPSENADDIAAAWYSADIAAGLPWIESAVQDLFIPQTLNLDLIEGVNFTKGCFPGQEVVARSHYRGTIKRRMAYGVAQTDQAQSHGAGADIFDAVNPGKPAGRVVNAAVHNGKTHLLLEVHLSDLNNADYRLDSAQGTPIQIHDMPYPIQSDTDNP